MSVFDIAVVTRMPLYILLYLVVVGDRCDLKHWLGVLGGGWASNRSGWL